MTSLRGHVVVSTVVLLLLLFVFSNGSTTVTTTTNTNIKFQADDDISNDKNNGDNMVVKVFILAGQSNMVGMGSVQHLHELINNNNTTTTASSSSTLSHAACNVNEYCKDLWNVKTNSFKIRQNVFIKYNNAYGNLTVGNGFASNNRFGPELGFGWVVGGGDDNDDDDDVDDDDTTSTTTTTTSIRGGGSTTTTSATRKLIKQQQQRHRRRPNIIYIIKAAWGGRSLAVDFRSPASGEGNYDNVKPHFYGWEYREMITSITDGLNQIATIIPGYNHDTNAFEISGFVWFQGWNDLINMPFVLEYGTNLVNFMHDVRKELDIPNLPIVIGELGMHGTHLPTSSVVAYRVMRMRAAQKAATLVPEFYNSSQFVPTTPYVDMIVNDNKTFDGIHHYNGRADTYYHIGKAFGRAMLTLLEKQS